MRWSYRSGALHAQLGILALLFAQTVAAGQANVQTQPVPSGPKFPRPPASDANIKAINDEFDQQLVQLERRRLDRLARLAAGQNPAEAAATYEQLFRLTIASNLFAEAEAAAVVILKSGSPSHTATELAHVVKIIAECDRGAYDQSLESLRQAVADRARSPQSGWRRAQLTTSEVVELCDAYYQRLIHAGQFEKARQALQLIAGATERPVVKEFLSRRLARLNLVGKPAPAIEGKDLDGKPFRLADARGNVVLVVFWSSWCVPCANEIESLQQVADSYRAQRFQIVGINLDAEDAGLKPEIALPNVRHFLLDHNVEWPTLVNGLGNADFAKSYGVTEVPANVLIARDGTIADIDLVRKNLEPVIARTVGEGKPRIP